jgi:hypothetical protein
MTNATTGENEMKPKMQNESQVSITEIQLTQVSFHLVGVSPLVPHAVSFKNKGQLLFPSGRKSAAEKATSMKHDPFDEFRDAAYKFKDNDQPTRLYMPGGAFHSAMANAAIDMVGAKKAQIGRLTNIVGDKICVWGVPQIYSTIVRSSDMARTPDVRTLPIIPKWAASITVQFVGSLIKTASVANLLGAAGVIIGIGDGRPEKGKLAYGKFRVVSEDDAELIQIMKSGGLRPQDEALADPAFYDAETEELLSWFETEKGQRIASPAKEQPKSKVKNGNGKEAHGSA